MEIVVTAQKRSEDLQSVPIAITAISREALASSGDTSLADIGNAVAGVHMPATNGLLTPNIRGIGTVALGAGLENSTAIYVDGVYYGTGSASILDLSDISQIQVLKGPQGTLFGRNATAGAILIQTQDPVQSPTGRFELGYGNYQTGTADAYVSGGLTDELAADLSIHATEQGQGYGRNLFNGDGVNRLNDDVTARSKLLFRLTDTSTIRIGVDYTDRSGNLETTSRPVPGTTPAFGPAFDGSPWDTSLNTQPKDRLQAGGASGQIDYDMSWASLTSITAYRASKYLVVLDTDYTQTPALSIPNGLEYDRQITQEFDLKSPAFSRLQWVTGMFYYWQTARYDDFTFAYGPAFPFSPNLNAVTDDVQTTHSYAGFAQATADVAAATHLTLGIRYTTEKRELDGTQSATQGGFPLPAFVLPQLGLEPSVNTSRDFDKTTWRIALDHKFDDGQLIYASYNTGFKSGGFNTNIPSEPAFQPETLGAYEIGVKSQFLDDKVRLNGAVFYYDYKNMQIARYLNGETLYYNGASARIYGTDFDAEAVVYAGLKLVAGLSLLNDEFTSFPNADYEIPQSFGGNETVVRSAKGNHLPYTADATLNLTATYEMRTSIGIWNLFAGESYASGWYASPDNILRQSPYWMANASVQWQPVEGRYGVKLWGKNLTDRAVAATLVEANQGDAVQYAPPRTYGVSFFMNFQ
jgi:iron complex outermembrane recepter protein